MKALSISDARLGSYVPSGHYSLIGASKRTRTYASRTSIKSRALLSGARSVGAALTVKSAVRSLSQNKAVCHKPRRRPPVPDEYVYNVVDARRHRQRNRQSVRKSPLMDSCAAPPSPRYSRRPANEGTTTPKILAAARLETNARPSSQLGTPPAISPPRTPNGTNAASPSACVPVPAIPL